MELEKKLAQYVSDSDFDSLSSESIDVIKHVVLAIIGTIIAGSTSESCEAVVNQAREWGGKEEATILIYGGKVPAYNAALTNSYMARALDFCDAMVPGMHIGSSSVPTALATAELAGGCTGKEFITALVLGSEIAARINSVSDYDGFDPTGVCAIFASTAIAGKILRLNSEQMLNALALAFNRSGGSFQSNVDGALAVRMIQGFVSQAGIQCAQFARIGVTGPKNFLQGIYGYFHLYAKDKYDPEMILNELGNRFEFTRILFKKYPSCGGTLASTDAILELVREKGFSPENIARIDIKVTPYIYKLVGHPFEVGNNPRVNAQFSIQYCVANALLRKNPKFRHFEESSVREPRIREILKNIYIISDPTLNSLGDAAADVDVTLKDGSVYHKKIEIAHGFPGNQLTDEEHTERFQDCISYGGKPLPKENTDKLMTMVNQLEEVEDVRSLIPLLI